MAETKKTTQRESADTGTFSAEERAAMKERAAELRKQKKGADAEADVLAKIAEMGDADRVIAERLHALVKEVVPGVPSKTWYGFPAYLKGKDIVMFYQPASRFGARYGTLGFDDTANLDDGDVWPTSYALSTWNDSVEATVRALIAKAFS